MACFPQWFSSLGESRSSIWGFWSDPFDRNCLSLLQPVLVKVSGCCQDLIANYLQGVDKVRLARGDVTTCLHTV